MLTGKEFHNLITLLEKENFETSVLLLHKSNLFGLCNLLPLGSGKIKSSDFISTKPNFNLYKNNKSDLKRLCSKDSKLHNIKRWLI